LMRIFFEPQRYVLTVVFCDYKKQKSRFKKLKRDPVL
jgi:hypothetical protein